MRAPYALLMAVNHSGIVHRASGHAFGCSPRRAWLAPRTPVGYLPLSLPEGANPIISLRCTQATNPNRFE